MTVIILHPSWRGLLEAEGLDADAMGVEFVERLQRSELDRIDAEIRVIEDQCRKWASSPLHLVSPQAERPYYRQRQRW